jgi:hypothetical protein
VSGIDDPHPEHPIVEPDPPERVDVPVVPMEPLVEPPPLEKPDDREAVIAMAALKVGRPLQDGVPEDAVVEDFKK